MKILGAFLDLINKKAVNMADPSAPTDGVNLQTLQAYARGLDWKPEVVAASTTNVSLTAPGTTLDGVTLSVGMQVIAQIGTVTRILLKDQTAAAENGIYDWTGSAVALVRSVDADSATELSGSTVTVQRGTVNGDRVYRVTADDPIVLGTTAITMAQVGAGSAPYTAGNGLVLTAQDFNVAVSAGLTVAADSVGIDTAVVVRKFAVNVGDGAATSIIKAHGLGTADLTLTVVAVATGEVVYPDLTVDATNVTLVFAVAPTTNQYRLIAHG